MNLKGNLDRICLRGVWKTLPETPTPARSARPDLLLTSHGIRIVRRNLPPQFSRLVSLDLENVALSLGETADILTFL